MKNRIAFAALTFAFTIAGACIGYLVNTGGEAMCYVVFVVAGIGGMAAGLSAETEA